MIEFEKPTGLMHFRFNCPNGKETEAREILSKLTGVTVFKETVEAFDVVLIREENRTAVVQGIEISGLTRASNIEEIIIVLAEPGIAGHTPERKIYIADPNQYFKIGEQKA
ncbi:hypothetical protein HYT02_00400 [Candidatus Gottesmanbacteria bacterium]|nr:hypothetical protein [Candidatus Gottesmanbacteria bacterium]